MSLWDIKIFVKDGKYQKLRYAEKRLMLLKELIREDMKKQEKRLMKWEDVGVVGKFNNVKKYEYDHDKLNDYLFDLGLLPIVGSVDEKLLNKNQLELLKPQTKQNMIPHVRFYPNKLVRVDIPSLEQLHLVRNMTILDIVTLWKKNKEILELFSLEWNRLKIVAAGSDAFKENNHVVWEHGTFVLGHKVEYNSEDVIKILGEETFINICRVDFSRLEEYAAKGYFRKPDIEKYRKLKDIKEKFTLVECKKEEIIKKNYANQVKRLSEISRNRL